MPYSYAGVFTNMQINLLNNLILPVLLLLGTTSFADQITANIQRDLNLLGYNAGPIDGVSVNQKFSSIKSSILSQRR